MKVECDIRPNRLFAPQLVGLVSSLDRKGRPNVATLAWITSVSAEPRNQTLTTKRMGNST